MTVAALGEETSLGTPATRIADEHELSGYMRQVLDMATRMLQDYRACNRNSAGSSDSAAGHEDYPGAIYECPGIAPELLQGNTAAFLASVLRSFPRGPSSRQALISWTAASSSFLDEHHRLQRQQRNTTAAIAAAAANIAASHEAERVAAAKEAATLKPAQERNDGDGGGGDDGQQQYGTEAGSHRRTLRARLIGGELDRSGTGVGEEVPAEGGADYHTNDNGGDGGVDSGDNGDYIFQDVGSDSESADADDGGGDNGSGGIPANFTGVPYGGLPLLRRVLLAQLLLGWRHAVHHDGQAVSAVAEEELSKVVTLLYKIHVESVVQRAVMEYFHISKAGGTSWTAAAIASGCECPRATAARVREFDDDCRWINGTLMRLLGVKLRPAAPMQVCSRFDITRRQTHTRTCSGRLRTALGSGLQYTSNEYTLHGGLEDVAATHLCPQFVNVISIREPLSRLMSNVKYMLVRLHDTLFRKPTASKVFAEVFCNATAALWERYAPPVADNYNIRALVGEAGFHTPLYGIGEAHEALAKQLLLQFDLILDLDEGDAASDLLMRAGLGWKKTLAKVRVWTLDKLAKKSEVDLEESCQVGDLTPLLKRQVYDQRWYSFGRTLSRLDQLFLSAASRLGMRPWPEDWASEVLRPPGGAVPPSKADAAQRCGLLGAAQRLAWPAGTGDSGAARAA